MASDKPFLTDVKTLRERARQHLETGAIGSNYVGDVKKTIEVLQSVLATELVCVLRYGMHSVAASGISSEAIKAEFATHAKEEHGHAMAWPNASINWAASRTSIPKAWCRVRLPNMAKAPIW